MQVFSEILTLVQNYRSQYYGESNRIEDIQGFNIVEITFKNVLTLKNLIGIVGR